METAFLVLGIVVALGILGALVVLIRRSQGQQPAEDATGILHQRLDALTKLISEQLSEGRQSTERATQSVHRQVQDFTAGMTRLHEEVKQMQDQVKHVVSFQDIFRAPKLRGSWGEYSLESALGQYFPRASWKMQHMFATGDIVDAVVTLPNGLVVPIDSKFNWENFKKMIDAETDATRDPFRKSFIGDVKKKVDEIAEKYLLPGEGTTDFALMYVPAETVYYEMINNIGDTDIADYARKKKVILCSPNTFYLTVTAVMHWFKDVQFAQQTRDIFKRLKQLETDAGKLSDEFRVLGKHISNAQSAYNDSEKRVGLFVDRAQRVLEMADQSAPDTKIPPTVIE
ncbi:MAG: DNA recombination protein RmuC [Patescibacteria group bacterium]